MENSQNEKKPKKELVNALKNAVFDVIKIWVCGKPFRLAATPENLKMIKELNEKELFEKLNN